jgi:hypothetical protein
MSCLDKPRQDTELNSTNTEFVFPQGTWLLTQYFDSAIEALSVYDVRTVKPSLFGAIVILTSDSLVTYGTLDGHAFKLSDVKKNSSIEIKGSYGDWRLTAAGDSLSIMEINSKEKGRVYSYRRYTGTLSASMKEKDVRAFFTTFFNKHILSGEYEVERPNTKRAKRVIFSENGGLTTMGDYDRYEINAFYGSRHPYTESDALLIWNSRNDSTKVLAWKYKDKNLLLFNVVDDEEYPGEVFRKGSEFMTLKKIK